MAETKITIRQQKFSGCKYTTNKSVPSGGAIANDTWSSDYDTDSYLQSSTQFTAPADGKYLIVATAQFESNSTGYRRLHLRVNGTEIEKSMQRNANISTGDTTVVCSDVLDLTAGDYVEYMLTQNSGVSLLLRLGESSMAMTRIG